MAQCRAVASRAPAARREADKVTTTPPFPALPGPIPPARYAVAEELRSAIALWTVWLAGERRASAHTVAAYGRDLAFFFDFLTEHLGEPPGLAALGRLVPADFRAWLAEEATEGRGNATRSRHLAEEAAHRR